MKTLFVNHHIYHQANRSHRRRSPALMAKRGRPRKRGGLLRADFVSRASIAGSEGVRNGQGLDVDSLRVSIVGSEDVVVSCPYEKMLPEVWADEEGEVIENLVTLEPTNRSLYQSALQRGVRDKGDGTGLEPRPMAGNRDLNKGMRLSRKPRRDEEIVISKEAVQEGLDFWALSLIGYVLGDRVPFSVIEGFVRA
ncbi:hypothetical protein Dimus_023491 [Dionaea muscipula]